jgi:hypothetical protein
MKFARVEDEPNLVRDTHSRAILNVDSTGLEAYKRKKQARAMQTYQIQELNNDVHKIKSEIIEIKNLLSRLLINK